MYVIDVVDTHIESSKMLIKKAADFAGNGRAAVLGCGKCSEIPVPYLIRKFFQIDFVDRDKDRFFHSKVQFDYLYNKMPGKTMFYNDDLTGIIARIRAMKNEVIGNHHTPVSLLDKLGSLLLQTSPVFWKPPGNEKYQFVVCSAVLTQLQAGVRKSVEEIFLSMYPDAYELLQTNHKWKENAWSFARKLENAFVDHLDFLLLPGGIVYLSDTIHVFFLKKNSSGQFVTNGSWIAAKTADIADYLGENHEIIIKGSWDWLRLKDEGDYCGRNYIVQAVVYKKGKSNGAI